MSNSKDKFNLYSWRDIPYWLKFLMITTLVIGILFRLVNLDKKVYWLDEVSTSLRVAGYSYMNVKNELFTGNIIPIDALMKYQRISPEKSWIDTIKAVAKAPEHPPLYYLIARLWSQLFGTSITAMRSLTALISLLIFPSIYWLSWELFQKASVGWIAIALVAVSPFHILYAQEARQYSLWTVTVILSSAAFLRALRLETRRSWTIYVISMILGLYTHSFSVLLAIEQGVYLVFREGFRWSKTWKNYILSSVGILILWLPWVFVLIRQLSSHREGLAWLEANLSKTELITKFFFNYTRCLIDFKQSFTPSLYVAIISILVLSLVSYSIYVIIKRNQGNQNQIWLFLLLLILVIPLTLLIPDLIVGGRRVTVSRYFVPSYIGIHLAVAYLINSQITMANTRQKTLGKMLIALLLSCGILSSSISFSAECWWNKSASSCENISVANIVNLAPRPLIISNQSPTMGQILSLSYRLKPEVKFLLISERNQLKISQGFSDLFLYNPSEELRAEIQRSRPFKIQSVYEGKYLKLEKLVVPK